MKGVTPEVRALVHEAKALGWSASVIRKGRVRFDMPGCRSVYSAAVIHDRRAMLNVRAELRRVAGQGGEK